MSNIVRCGLIQTKNDIVSPEGGTDKKLLAKIKDSMLEKHLKMTKEAHDKGVKILCFQEIFNGPYFCAEQETCWYDTAESIRYFKHNLPPSACISAMTAISPKAPAPLV
jgi:N-carbamoylputrescine amidase